MGGYVTAVQRYYTLGEAVDATMTEFIREWSLWGLLSGLHLHSFTLHDVFSLLTS